jgi:transposase
LLRLREPKQFSFHNELYNKIPDNHILKKITRTVDFSFINDILEDTYCKEFGRPAKEPELMCKLLFLQHIYNLSDEGVRQEASLNLAYMYFLRINPEDTLPNKSLISKFRVHRIGEETLNEVMLAIVKQCIDKGILKGKSVSVDATHIEANTKKKVPERLMKHLGRKIMESYEEENGTPLKDVPQAPDYKEMEDHKEAKEAMKAYLETVIDMVEKQNLSTGQNTNKWIHKSKEILADPKFMNQKGARSLVDKDARVGRKSKTESFYGYKTEFVMTCDERIITSVRTADGSYVDGTYTKEMLEDTIKAGLTIDEVYGDKAYFRKSILDNIKDIQAKAYIPVSSTVYRLDDSAYTYNKDSDEWQCSQGNTTVRKKYYKSKRKDGDREGYKYYFELNQCKACPLQQECAKSSARKILTVGLNTTEFYEISQHQKTNEFKEKYKKRASIEGKNAELKRFHGLSRSRGYGLLSVSKQAQLAAIAVNLKRIAALIP